MVTRRTKLTCLITSSLPRPCPWCPRRLPTLCPSWTLSFLLCATSVYRSPLESSSSTISGNSSSTRSVTRKLGTRTASPHPPAVAPRRKVPPSQEIPSSGRESIYTKTTRSMNILSRKGIKAKVESYYTHQHHLMVEVDELLEGALVVRGPDTAVDVRPRRRSSRRTGCRAIPAPPRRR
jgi:hypothetical protein